MTDKSNLFEDGSVEFPHTIAKKDEPGSAPSAIWNQVWKDKKPRTVYFEGVKYDLTPNGEVNVRNKAELSPVKLAETEGVVDALKSLRPIQFGQEP